MQMVGVREKDWFDEEEVLEKFMSKPRRAAVTPFSQDQRFAEARTYVYQAFRQQECVYTWWLCPKNLIP